MLLDSEDRIRRDRRIPREALEGYKYHSFLFPINKIMKNSGTVES